VDGEEGPEYDVAGKIVFSPDGRRFAYGIQRGREQLVVVDGEEGPEFEAVVAASGPRFTAAGAVRYLAARASADGRQASIFRVEHAAPPKISDSDPASPWKITLGAGMALVLSAVVLIIIRRRRRRRAS